MSVKHLGKDKYLIDTTWNEGNRRCRLRRQVCGSLKDAKKWERDLKNAARLGHVITGEKKKERQLFPDFAWEWFDTYVKANNKLGEQKNKETLLRLHLIPFFNHFYLDEISVRDVERYKASLIPRYSPRTVNLHLACLQKLFQSAVDWELCEKNPVRKVKSMKERKDAWQFLDFEEAEKFMQAVPDHWQPFFLCALRTGMRVGEIIALRWQDIDWKRKIITVRNSISFGQLSPTKSYGTREVPITQDIFETLLQTRHIKGDFVFCRDDGMPLHRSTTKRPLNTANRRSGVKKIRFHDLRHTFASHLAISGVSIKTIQELLGHADLKMTLRYAHLTQACKTEAINMLEERILKVGCVKNVTPNDSTAIGKCATH